MPCIKKLVGKLLNKDVIIINRLFFYKMMNSLTPLYLTSLVPQPVSNLSRKNLRNSNDLQSINARTKQYYHSFLPSAVRAWNNLPMDIKQSASLQCFKNSLKKNTQAQVPNYYYIGSGRSIKKSQKLF